MQPWANDEERNAEWRAIWQNWLLYAGILLLPAAAIAYLVL
jgi:hypothetical protein